jgi:hypothetical protein
MKATESLILLVTQNSSTFAFINFYRSHYSGHLCYDMVEKQS